MVELEHARALLNKWGCRQRLNFWMLSWSSPSTHSRPMCSFSMNCFLLNSSNASGRAGNRLKLARLPHRKGLEDFDFAFQPSIDKRQ